MTRKGRRVKFHHIGDLLPGEKEMYTRKNLRQEAMRRIEEDLLEALKQGAIPTADIDCELKAKRECAQCVAYTDGCTIQSGSGDASTCKYYTVIEVEEDYVRLEFGRYSFFYEYDPWVDDCPYVMGCLGNEIILLIEEPDLPEGSAINKLLFGIGRWING